MIGIELVKNREKKTPAKDETEKNKRPGERGGLLIGSGGVKGCVLRIQPPLAIEREQIDKALEILEATIKEI